MERSIMIKFYRGESEKYNSETHNDGIFFTTDTDEILVNSDSYGKNADKALTTEAITIEGGPLASDSVKAAYPGGQIPAGTSIQDIFNTLLCTEIWPTPSVTPATLTASVTAPTPSLSATSKSSSYVEVGDTITVSAMTAGNTTYGGTTTTTVTGFTHGLSVEDDNTADKNDNGSVKTSLQVNRSTPTASGTHSMTVTVTGMTGTSFTQPTANATAASVTCAKFTGTAVKGSNKVSVTENGVTYSATVPAIDSVYICSNLGKTKGRKFEGVAANNSLSATPSASTKSAELTGVYAIYSTGTLYDSFSTSANDTNAWNNQNDTYMKFSNETTPQRMKLSSVTNGTTKFYGYIGFGADSPETKKFVLLPTGWKIDSVHIPDSSVAGKWITSTNQTATRIKGTDEAEAGYDFTNNSGGVSKYTKWQIKGSTAANLFKLTISKTN